MTDVTKIVDTLNKSGQYFKVLDNTSFGFLLQKDGVHEVIGSQTMEGRNHVCLKIDAFSNDNVWIAESRGEYTTKSYESGKATLSQYIDKLTPDADTIQQRIKKLKSVFMLSSLVQFKYVQDVGEPNAVNFKVSMAGGHHTFGTPDQYEPFMRKYISYLESKEVMK